MYLRRFDATAALLVILALAGCRAETSTDDTDAATAPANQAAADAMPQPLATTAASEAKSTSGADSTPSTPGPSPAPTGGNSIAGWYMEAGDHGRVQLCGQAGTLQVDSAELRSRANAVSPGNPVYVRIAGTTNGTTLTVDRIEQVGSETPVRDCGLTGVVTPARQ